MDDIYGDLENYNDVNALDELRKENQQLKFRLKEKSVDMEKLQKDYDKVSSDFKKMEINFSSLLKTSRAEIERKTQMICNLNMEKDAMVLITLQNNNKTIMNIRSNLLRDKSHNVRKNKKDNDLDCSKPNRKAEPKKFDLEKERKEEIRLPSADTVTSGSTDNCTEKKHEKNSDTKENIAKVKSRAQSIRNRRKSMPVLGKQLPNFSSDEENDDNSANESKKKDRYARDEKSRRNPERNYNEKVLHKIAETSGIDEKYSSYHESSRETYYRGKSGRQSDKHKSVRDKYEQSQKPQRPRRHFSPDKSHRKAPRDNAEEYYQRSDYGRHRVLESPPPDKLEIQRRNRRFNYDRENQFEFKHRPHYEKHSVPMKHKLSDDTEELSSKRAKTHSSSKNIEEEENRNKHREMVESSVPSRISDSPQLTSCLSPDYIDPEIVEPVKEIMSTSKVNLEDPRLKSQKYITQNADDKATLCTISSRNVELKPIDRSTWNTERVQVPEALKHAPQFTEELVQQVYKDADKPISCMTPESGEIQSDNELVDFGPDSYFNEIYEQEKQRVRDLNLHNVYDNKTRDFNSSKYRFCDNNTDTKLTCDEVKQLDMPLTEYVIDKAKHDNKSDTRITIKLSKKDAGNSNQQRKSGPENKEAMRHSSEEKVLSYREIVEGDLELSDETNDNILETQTKDKCRTRSQHLNLENKSKSAVVSKEKKKKSEERTIITTKREEKHEEPLAETIKKPKSKKKSHKTKLKSPGSTKTEEATLKQTAEQATKLTVEPKRADTIKDKFTDLFGESSSLITPEDLGVIPSTHANKYVPIFEDAVDANDINVKHIAQTQKDYENKSDAAKEMKEGVKQKAKLKEKKKRSKKNDDKRSSVDIKEEREKGIDTPNCQAVTKEPDVVNTVIISTGVQPQIPPEEHIKSIADRQQNIVLESKVANVEHNDVLTHVQPSVVPQEQNDIVSQVDNAQGNEVLTHVKSIVAPQEKMNVVSEIENVPHNDLLSRLQQLQPAALATSTPYKELPVKNVFLEPDQKTESNDSRTRNEAATPSDLSSNLDTNSLTETDAPDIRIFVKRRKKVLKKTVCHKLE